MTTVFPNTPEPTYNSSFCPWPLHTDISLNNVFTVAHGIYDSLLSNISILGQIGEIQTVFAC